MNRRDFQRLALVRLDEARVLLEAEKFEGCHYLSGYVIECALKACIAKLTKRHSFPDKFAVQNSYSHDFSLLLRTAGIQEALAVERDRNPAFATHWNTVRDWNEQKRYERSDAEDAMKLFRAITDPKHGVLRWIKRYW
ncbi:MAG: HEPN domain-containing protein [Acidobacteria bacterium]|nr:HEPN domain-containing protein [Acidobacteriota bacterium]